MAHHILTVPRSKLFETTMDNLPKIIPSALTHIINTFESDSDHQFQWKSIRNLENVKLLMKCEICTKFIDGDQPFPVNRKPGSSKKKSILLDLLHHTDIDNDDKSFEFPEINVCSNCKRQPEKNVELKRCSWCNIKKIRIVILLLNITMTRNWNIQNPNSAFKTKMGNN